MSERRKRLGKLAALPVLAVCGFLAAATFAGVGFGVITTDSTTTDTTTTITTTTETTTTETTTTTPPGGEGCTPGYWKQSQHFDSYPAGILPTTLLSAVGINSSVSFLTALSTSGGGVDALLRHAAAAYLNAASADVDYDLSTADVVALTNAALANASLVESTKDIFESNNEDGCPLS